MIVFPFLLADPATEAGMSVPDDIDNEDPSTFRDSHPHFFVYCALQCGASLPSPTAHWDNAKIIAKVPLDKLKTMTIADFRALGVV
jgi:hypothetical protein